MAIDVSIAAVRCASIELIGEALARSPEVVRDLHAQPQHRVVAAKPAEPRRHLRGDRRRARDNAVQGLPGCKLKRGRLSSAARSSANSFVEVKAVPVCKPRPGDYSRVFPDDRAHEE